MKLKSRSALKEWFHSLPPPLSAGRAEGVNFPPIFQKGGVGLNRNSIFRGGLLEKWGVNFFFGGGGGVAILLKLYYLNF